MSHRRPALLVTQLCRYVGQFAGLLYALMIASSIGLVLVLTSYTQ